MGGGGGEGLGKLVHIYYGWFRWLVFRCVCLGSFWLGSSRIVGWVDCLLVGLVG